MTFMNRLPLGCFYPGLFSFRLLISSALFFFPEEISRLSQAVLWFPLRLWPPCIAVGEQRIFHIPLWRGLRRSVCSRCRHGKNLALVKTQKIIQHLVEIIRCGRSGNRRIFQPFIVHRKTLDALTMYSFNLSVAQMRK